jgi:hypothetical protein
MLNTLLPLLINQAGIANVVNGYAKALERIVYPPLLDRFSG